MSIRPAAREDLPAILAITNDVIATSTAIYNDQPVTLESRVEWFEARRRLGYPVLVAEAGASIVGFSSFGDFRSWPGYRHTVEHSIHIARDFRGRGTGSALVRALYPLASALGKHVMIAGVDAANESSIRFHERLGFERAAHLREVGRKFGRWLDLVLLQRFLDEPGAERRDDGARSAVTTKRGAP
ncbi:MAG: N-acetyltransferase family protein [Hyphomicrobiaceae bacterium]